MYKIKIPIIKVSANQYYSGKHWSVRAKHKSNYLKLCNGFKDLEPVDCKVDIAMEFFYKTRALDSSNNSAMFKMIEDTLVKFGVFKDDNINYVGWCAMKSTKDKKAKEDYCIVTISKA